MKKGDIDDTVRAAIDAWNAGDVEGFLAVYTDNGIQDDFDATREEATQALADFIGDPPIEIREISNTEVSGDTATTELETAEGNVIGRERISFVREDSVWLADGFEELLVAIPEGVTPIDVQMGDFSFSFDDSAITSGNIAIRGTNVGQQPHHLILVKIPADLNLQEALQSEEQPEGVEDIGGTDVLDPGAETNMVFTQALAPGRYVMLCFIEDPATGQEHVNLGMVAEFTVPGEAAEETPTEEATP